MSDSELSELRAQHSAIGHIVDEYEAKVDSVIKALTQVREKQRAIERRLRKMEAEVKE